MTITHLQQYGRIICKPGRVGRSTTHISEANCKLCLTTYDAAMQMRTRKIDYKNPVTHFGEGNRLLCKGHAVYPQTTKHVVEVTCSKCRVKLRTTFKA